MAIARRLAADRGDLENDPRSAALYRQTFVGREAELLRLRGAFDAAIGEDSSLVALPGEPGVGKTALCEQLIAHARRQGGRALVGHCYQAGSLSLPYLPFIEALRKHVLDVDEDELRAELGDGATDIARIVPEVRVKVPVPDRVGGDPDSERWRLLHAVTDFLRATSRIRPLLVVLEDLQDADQATLDLLVHLSRNLRGARLLLVCTYRDVEVVRTHPLSAALAELRRGSNFQRLPLRGLDLDEVRQMLTSLSQHAIPPVFAELVHRQTEGNPLFVQELLRYVIEQGLVESQDGMLRRVGDTSLVERIPEGLRDVIGQRLSRLSDGANQVLANASVFGQEFRLDALFRLCRVPEDDVISALEEAARVGLVEEQASASHKGEIVYRFTHAFFRQTLYSEMSAPRRIRLHLEAAKLLEEIHAARLAEHGAELAEHWSHSSDPAHLAKAVMYCETASQQAVQVFAYGEAARHLERALDIQDVLDPDAQMRRCDLLLEFGAALVFAGSGRRAANEVAPLALRLAEAIGDRHRAFRACTIAQEGLQTLSGWMTASLPGYAEWVDQADRWADPDSSERARADYVLGFIRERRNERRGARELWMRGLHLARLHQDRRVIFEGGMGLLARGAFPDTWSEQVELAETFSTSAREGVSSRLVGNVLMYCGLTLLAEGRRRRFDEVWRESVSVHATGYAAGAYVLQPGKEMLVALLDGQLQSAIQLGGKGAERGDEVGRPVMGRILPYWFMFSAWLYLGYPERALEAVRDFLASAGAPQPDTLTQLMLAVGHSRMGRHDEAKALAGRLPDADELLVAELALRLELAVLWHDRPAAAELAERLGPVDHLAMVNGFTPCVARLIGQRWLMDDDADHARDAFETAIRVCERMRCRPELALARLDLAELLLAHYPDAREYRAALELLQVVAADAESMNMQPALERATRLVKSAGTAHGLTRREQQVAALIAAGRTNRELAEALVISEATAEVHVKHILSKLGFKSRSQVVVWAAERGLPTSVDYELVRRSQTDQESPSGSRHSLQSSRQPTNTLILEHTC